MKGFYKVLTVTIISFAVIFVFANLLLYSAGRKQSGRPYRVEINRIALQIEQNGLKNVDLSQCSYVYHVAECSEDFFDTDSDYVVRKINGRLYRFDYRAVDTDGNLQIMVAVNIILAVVMGAVVGALFYVYKKILRPFERLTNVPYELSRGILTSPVKESKNRFFGKFLWGIDLLRENIEQQKCRELELQKEKKTLLLSLSHDIKTPLSAIKLYAKALSKNLYTDPQKKCEIAGSINEKADEIEAYISEIVLASREDFLSLDVENGEFYLSELVQGIAAYYREKVSLVKTEFVVETYKNCLLYGDLNRSMEVLQNVIENALKYGDGSKIELLFPDGEEEVLVAVRNGGCTLEKEELPYIFESFWRGKNSENISGSGLGLYICRQLMHKMNGEIFAKMDKTSITVTAVFGKA